MNPSEIQTLMLVKVDASAKPVFQMLRCFGKPQYCYGALSRFIFSVCSY